MYPLAGITPRSRIAVRWTTDPKTIGYADTADQAFSAIRSYLDSDPDYISTPRVIVERIIPDIARKTGGAVYRIDLTVCATGEQILECDLRDTWFYLDYLKNQKRRGGVYL